MSEIDDLLREFPPGVRERLRSAWERAPEAARGPVLRAVRELPGDLGSWRALTRLALTHLRLVTGEKRRVAIVGPTNVGRSTPRPGRPISWSWCSTPSRASSRRNSNCSPSCADWNGRTSWC